MISHYVHINAAVLCYTTAPSRMWIIIYVRFMLHKFHPRAPPAELSKAPMSSTWTAKSVIAGVNFGFINSFPAKEPKKELMAKCIKFIALSINHQPKSGLGYCGQGEKLTK
jgi:hypothetical protein